MNIAMLLEMAAEGDPERVVLGSHDGGITASDLLERSRRAAIYFEKSGAEVVGYFGLNTDTLPGRALRRRPGRHARSRRSTTAPPTSSSGASSAASPAAS